MGLVYLEVDVEVGLGFSRLLGPQGRKCLPGVDYIYRRNWSSVQGGDMCNLTL